MIWDKCTLKNIIHKNTAENSYRAFGRLVQINWDKTLVINAAKKARCQFYIVQ